MTKPTEEAYQELQIAYDHFNRHLFNGKLPDCLITFQREKQTCGYFSAKRFVNAKGNFTDEIALNPSYFAQSGLLGIMQTLVHEMCHLWQYHFGKPSRKCYHNTEWALKMEAIGLMPSDTGQEGGKKTGQTMSDYPIAQGKFVKVCETLLAQPGFSISWFDRYQPAEKSKYEQGFHQLIKNLLNQGYQQNTADLAHELSDSQAFSEIVSNELVTSDWLIPTIDKKQTRLKYTCACGNNIWGKPNLRIMCHECGQDFTPNEANHRADLEVIQESNHAKNSV